MNDIAGAMGVAQMEKLDSFLERRCEVVRSYRDLLADCDELILPPEPDAGIEPSPYFFWIQTEERDRLAHYLLEHGVYTTFRYWPLHKIPLFGQGDAHLPDAEDASRITLNLPLHPDLSSADVEKIVGLVKRFGRQNL